MHKALGAKPRPYTDEALRCIATQFAAEGNDARKVERK